MLTADAVLRGCAVDLAGISVHLVAHEPSGASALVSTLGGGRSTDAHPQGQLTVRADALSVPSFPPDSTTTEFETWRPGPGELVIRHRSGLIARATNATIDIGGHAAHYDAHFRRVCMNAVAHFLAQHDRFVVHAAAIAIDGRAVLVLGTTGAGKSTIALSALVAKWHVLADDLVVLTGSDAGVVIGGVPRPLAVPPDLLDGRELDSAPLADDPRGRRVLSPAVIAPGSYPIAGSIVLRHSDEPRGRIEPVDAHALLHDLLGSWAPIEGPGDLRRVLPIAATIARGAATALCLGNEPDTRVDDTIRLLDDVRAQFGLM